VFPPAKKPAAQEYLPIIVHSGRHSRAEVEAHFPAATTLAKPCPPAEMLQAANAVLKAQQA
jgi:hypothetical protein